MLQRWCWRKDMLGGITKLINNSQYLRNIYLWSSVWKILIRRCHCCPKGIYSDQKHVWKVYSFKTVCQRSDSNNKYHRCSFRGGRDNTFLLYEWQGNCPSHDSENIKHLAHSEYLRVFFLPNITILIEIECLNIKYLSLRCNYCIMYWHITIKRLTGCVIKLIVRQLCLKHCPMGAGYQKAFSPIHREASVI